MHSLYNSGMLLEKLTAFALRNAHTKCSCQKVFLFSGGPLFAKAISSRWIHSTWELEICEVQFVPCLLRCLSKRRGSSIGADHGSGLMRPLVTTKYGPKSTPPPPGMCYPTSHVVHGDGSSEVPWPLGQISCSSFWRGTLRTVSVLSQCRAALMFRDLQNLHSIFFRCY